jgi:adenylate cyclase
MSRLAQALMLGGVTALAGVLLSLAPPVLSLEESVGLDLLFRLRGGREPPAEAVIISVDKPSAEALGLPADPARWPRGMHARLVDHLARQGAAVIVFDIVFDRPGPPEEDGRFADAMRQAQNVVLAEYIERETVPVPGQPGGQGPTVPLERRVPPTPLLAEAALALAPFPLPKVPVQVSQYWTFKAGAGDTPTLPVVAFQVFALPLYDTLISLLGEVAPDQARALPPGRAAVVVGRHVEQVSRLARDLVQREPTVAARLVERLRAAPPPSLDASARRRLEALVRMYGGAPSRYLNFYGPPGTIPTIPYHQALPPEAGTPPAAPRLDISGKAVFVGLADPGESRRKDGFYTVFSQPSGADLSGVEIAATAFANLLAGAPVEPLVPYGHLATILAWGLGIGALARLLPPPLAVPAVLAAGLAYVVAAKVQFESAARWYPLVVPVFLQAPGAILAAVVWSYVEAHRERRNIRRALGYYLPPEEADRLARDRGALKTGSTLLYGTCLSTDAAQYTPLAEAMSPAELGAFMNRYYAAIFEPVKRHGGIVQNVVGDSMVAIWATRRQDTGLHRQACLAALDIARAVDRFNREARATPLPTRIGLHSGEFLLGNVGAIDHYEYRVVGDIVNTATRLENLNKYLGTRILVSGDVVAGLDGFVTRDLGTFLLVGKSKPVEVAELVDPSGRAAVQLRLCADFADALAAYRGGAWKHALELFRACLERTPDDGPARFFIRRCEQHLEHPPGEPWGGVVRMDQK